MRREHELVWLRRDSPKFVSARRCSERRNNNQTQWLMLLKVYQLSKTKNCNARVKLRVKKSSDLCFQQWIIRWYTEMMISNRKGFAIWIEYDDEVTHQPPKSHDAILFTLEQASRLSLPIHSSSARVAFSVHLERCENVWDLQALQELNYSSHMQILRSLRNLFDSLLEPSLTHSQQAFLSTSGGN